MIAWQAIRRAHWGLERAQIPQLERAIYRAAQVNMTKNITDWQAGNPCNGKWHPPTSTSRNHILTVQRESHTGDVTAWLVCCTNNLPCKLTGPRCGPQASCQDKQAVKKQEKAKTTWVSWPHGIKVYLAQMRTSKPALPPSVLLAQVPVQSRPTVQISLSPVLPGSSHQQSNRPAGNNRRRRFPFMRQHTLCQVTVRRAS